LKFVYSSHLVLIERKSRTALPSVARAPHALKHR
jgi:hypothetical protein